jgi:beta-lactamase class A
MRNELAGLFCILLLAQGCTTTTGPNPQKSAELQRSIEQIAHDAQGRVGAAVRLLENGQTVTVAGDEHFPMQSVYKMPIAMAVLHDVDAGLLRIDQTISIDQEQLAAGMLYSPIREKFPGGVKLTIHELLRYAVSESDNVASDVLMRLAGGPARITAYLRSLGIDEVVIVTTERDMAADATAQYRNWATPRGALKMLETFHAGAGLSSQSRTILMDALTETSTGPRRIKGLLPPGTIVAHKTGTSGTVAGARRPPTTSASSRFRMAGMSQSLCSSAIPQPTWMAANRRLPESPARPTITSVHNHVRTTSLLPVPLCARSSGT